MAAFEGYDVIGDVHGHAERLVALLRKLGYSDRAGAWRHPTRQAIFVGDLIDRGPDQLGCVRVARAMCEAESARIVLGNHEFNAIAYATEDPADPRRHLRPGHLDPRPATGAADGDKREKNFKQHRSYLEQVGGFGSALHRDHIDWFATMPLWLEIAGIRVVHACWHDSSMETVSGHLGDTGALTSELLVAATRDGTKEFAAVEILLKGPEVSLGADRGYLDKDGHPRTKSRTSWWAKGATNLRDLALVPGGVERFGDWPGGQLPEDPVPEHERITYDGDVPVIVGHYWATGRPEVWHPKVACVDYSVAKGGELVAYRWSGESVLTDLNFVAV